MALNLHNSSHLPQSIHMSSYLNAFLSPTYGFSSRISVSSNINFTLGASTSQSANILFFDSFIRDTANVVLPVPPLPLKITNCFIVLPPLQFYLKPFYLLLQLLFCQKFP